MTNTSRPIKFEYVGRNVMHGDIVRQVLSLDQIQAGHMIYTFFSPDNDNCELLAKRQFTGLSDKNGVNIFEGDILQGDDRIVEVYWNELGMWDCQWLQYIKKPTTNGMPKNQWHNSLIIGNIYENPEVLK